MKDQCKEKKKKLMTMLHLRNPMIGSNDVAWAKPPVQYPTLHAKFQKELGWGEERIKKNKVVIINKNSAGFSSHKLQKMQMVIFVVTLRIFLTVMVLIQLQKRFLRNPINQNISDLQRNLNNLTKPSI